MKTIKGEGMKTLYLILIIISFNSIADEVLKCSKEGTVIIYVNGQENEKEDAVATTQRLDYLINRIYTSIQLDKNEITLDYSYNRTFGKNQQGVAMADFLESAALLAASRPGVTLEEAWIAAYRTLMGLWNPQNPADRILESKTGAIELLDTPEILNQLYSASADDLNFLKSKARNYLGEDKKVIFISHSQGNIFVNLAYQDLGQENADINNKPFIEYVDLIGNLQIATPVSTIYIPNNKYITNSLDSILSVPFSLSPNYELNLPFPDPRIDLLDQTRNHSMLQTYLGGLIGGTIRGNLPELRNKVFNELEKIALALDSNCTEEIQGCDGAPGWSPQPNVFVANSARFDSTVTVPPQSPWLVEICQSAQVYGHANISGRVKITGGAKVHGNAFLNGFGSGLTVEGVADVMGHVEAYDKLVLTDSTTIHEGSYVYGKGTFNGNTVIGSASSGFGSEVTLDGTHVTDSTIIGSKVYADSYVVGSRIDNSEVKTSYVSNSIIEQTSKIDSSGVDASTITNSTITNSTVFLSSITNQSTIINSFIDSSSVNHVTVSAESSIFESSLSGGTCSGAFLFSGEGQGCSGGSVGTYTATAPTVPLLP